MEHLRRPGVLVWTLLLSALIQTNCFNLESRIPVIKYGDRGSYFGYSVAEHQVLNSAKQVHEGVLLIGAPKARTIAHGTVYNHSGAVYRCPLTTFSQDCTQLLIDQSVPVQNDVLKDDQWLGVTVNSQGPGGFVMACAHRYILKGGDFQWGQGICYSLKQNLDYHRAWQPCQNRPVAKAHEQFGYCQAGTSGTISEDSSIVIGTPGPFTWRGTVYTNNVPFALGQDKKWYFGPLRDDTAPVDKYSYLGMSVTSGKFFGNKTSFVAGAPRSNGTGQVVFFTKAKPDVTLLVQLILSGEQFASSYGYSLTSLDFNSDKYVDLIVGAPFYYSKGQGGAVYIYQNSNEGINENTVPIKLTGKPESRFGFSLAKAGDLNWDGYPDLAVGAPYEEGGGTVYIFLGSSDGIVQEPSQIIHADDIRKVALRKKPLSTFGYSLDGGIDLDNNRYPDLLVGAYETDTVVLLRSRPVLDIITSVTGNLTKIDPDAKGCPEDPTATNVCFSFKACFQFNSSATTQETSIRLQYKIEAETFTGKKYYRVKFASSRHTETPNIVKRVISVRSFSFGSLQCSDEVVYLRDKSDIQNPIKFKLTYSLIQKDPQMPKEGDRFPDINAFPILNQQEASKIFEAKFLKDCGSNDICESDLDIVADINLPRDDLRMPVLFLGEKQVNLSIKITNRKEPAYDAMLFIIHSASLSYVGRKVVKGDQIECVPFNKTVISCELGNPFKPGEAEMQIRFNPQAVSDEETKLYFTIMANTSSIEEKKRDDFKIEVEVVRVAELEIRGASTPEQVFYGGDGSVPKDLIYEEDVGSSVTHLYQVINHGPWWAKEVEVVIQWPYEEAHTFQHGRWLLYMTEAPEVQGNGYCTMRPDMVNRLNLKKRASAYTASYYRGERVSYLKQEPIQEVISEERRQEENMEDIVTLDCEMQTARCFQFSCIFKGLQRDQTGIIKIKARLWNSTFVQGYPTEKWVNVISRAHILLDSSQDNRQKEENDFAQAETKAYPDIPLYQKPEEIPLWIIIVSVCAGVLLLGLLVLLLWRLGFFKRKVPEYMPAPNSDREKEYM